MLIRGKILSQTNTRKVCLSRADSIRRWATEGARAYTNIQRKSIYIPTGSDTILDSANWFGANKGCAGYTSETIMIILKNQTGVAVRKDIVSGILSHYRKRFCAINMNCACEILVALGCADDTFYWGYSKWTPGEILQHKGFCGPTHEAKNARIQFGGGPPNKWCIFKGTLLSMMLDRIAVVVLLEGLNTINNVIGKCERYIN